MYVLTYGTYIYMYLLVLPVHFSDWFNYIGKLRPFLVVQLLHVCHSNGQEWPYYCVLFSEILLHTNLSLISAITFSALRKWVWLGAQMRPNERGSLGEVFQPSLHPLQLSLDGISQLGLHSSLEQ